MSSKRSPHLPKASGRTAFYVCLGIAAAGGLGVLLWPYLLWGSIMLSINMGWSTWGDATTPEPWDGCIPPRTAEERDEWVAYAEANNEPLCDPSIVNMEFPDNEPSGETI